ncbi:MAG: prop effector [Burkholderiales bacterium]|nr:prop effector [Burkholderiales bacterium]
MTDTVKPAAEALAETPAVAAQPAAKRPAKPDVFPVLEKLAALYPKHFGAEFLPLKRGIFQDLLDAHPDTFDRDLLKAALSFHTRSTRYLTVVASGQQRHDLQGTAVEAMAPEHVHHALLEVFRRRQARNNAKEDLRPKLVARIVQALEASGLTPLAYAELVRSRDEAANAVLDEALAEAEARAAKSEALLRAYEASGKTVEEFADMYGMDPRAVRRMLVRKPVTAV